MYSDPNLFWKNFRLGTELQISGRFLYNALYAFEEMEHFFYEDEIFEFLYSVSVGLERLEKIAVILLEHNENSDQDEFEKSLITHNHLELIKRISKKQTIKIGKVHMKFLQLIGEFYKSMRYNRFNVSSVYKPEQDQLKLIEFIERELHIQISTEMIFPTPNSKQIRDFIGKIIIKISSQLYGIITTEARRLQIYTYELPYNSKAYKIFGRQNYSFEKEKLLQKEILIYFINKGSEDNHFRFIKEIEPLNFDDYNSPSMINCLLNIHNSQDLLDSLEYLYEEEVQDKTRINEVQIIGDRNVFFEFDEEFDEELSE